MTAKMGRMIDTAVIEGPSTALFQVRLTGILIGCVGYAQMSRSRPEMKFCSVCSEKITRQVPPGDTLARYVCTVCGHIHYQNPKVVTGCIVTWDEKILLCKRAIEPRSGYWTIPAGFMELGETLEQAALRETMEEACAEAVIDELFSVYNIPHVSQVYVIFRAHLESAVFAPGEESLETDLFAENEIPWDDLAFRVVSKSLERYFSGLGDGDMRPFVGAIIA